MSRLFLNLLIGVLLLGVRYIPVSPSWEMLRVVLAFILGCGYTSILHYMTLREIKTQEPSLHNRIDEIVNRVSKQHERKGPPAPSSNTPIAQHVGTIVDANGSDS